MFSSLKKNSSCARSVGGCPAAPPSLPARSSLPPDMSPWHVQSAFTRQPPNGCATQEGERGARASSTARRLRRAVRGLREPREWSCGAGAQRLAPNGALPSRGLGRWMCVRRLLETLAPARSDPYAGPLAHRSVTGNALGGVGGGSIGLAHLAGRKTLARSAAAASAARRVAPTMVQTQTLACLYSRAGRLGAWLRVRRSARSA